jgi:septum site-determining protein MinC
MPESAKQKTAGRVSIKGMKDGLVVSIGGGDWPQLLDELTLRIQRKASFFDGGRAILDAGARRLGVEDLKQIRTLLADNGMQLYAIRTGVSETAEAAAALEIAVKSPVESLGPLFEVKPDQVSENGLFIKRTIRSGQTLHFAGHVTIIGDVNPGAEIVASGDIVVWGKLRGTVHAGAEGDDGAVVCALSLAPMQLRIGKHIARPPEVEERDPTVPEIALVDGQGIMVEPWNVAK